MVAFKSGIKEKGIQKFEKINAN
ncbi:hypothetical protein PI23P_01285 [Polaribacter irgensii 23-P]|uniref:Uncharacterized protein n=1 Tax=Polaribacter irgensii 23-P TaxID=313594 RepID=A4C2J4_9FLAO|nr:hypothetical protein PI23P_01285 [Polaribacter irgensii 23-P]